ncbi:uncharacterized protein LOC111636145 [Centruroides sculpturatus]|uniref:uncharacterized protein LOC111636145 n=2 Tax=Centruroides sculpturatus TaxID=218467 RepID=UPI000C6CB0C4|nr:uncharacterized protein LOC111636145 [Centruroides sculpturatus]
MDMTENTPLLITDVNENEIKNLMDELIEKSEEQRISMSQDWKERVTSSVLSNFISSAIPERTEWNYEQCVKYAHSQGYLPFDKFSQNTSCAKDLVIKEKVSLNKYMTSENVIHNHMCNINEQKKLCTKKRTRRHSWTCETHNQKDSITKKFDGNMLIKANIQHKSLSCLTDNHLYCDEKPSSFFSVTCENQRQLETSLSKHEYHLNNLKHNFYRNSNDVFDINDNSSNNSNLNSFKSCLNIEKSTYEPQKHIFYETDREIFITDVINNVQKFAKENNALNCKWSALDVEFNNECKSPCDHLNADVNDHKLTEPVDQNDDDLSNCEKVLMKENKSIQIKSDIKKKNELDKLYDSLREIRWAQNITVKSLMMETKMRRQSVRISKDLNSKKYPTSSTLYKRILPIRGIRKVEGSEKRAMVRKELANCLNSSELLSSKITKSKKDIKSSVLIKPKEKLCNINTKKIIICKSASQEKFGEKHLKNANKINKNKILCNSVSPKKISIEEDDNRRKKLHKPLLINKFNILSNNFQKDFINQSEINSDSSSIFDSSSISSSPEISLNEEEKVKQLVTNSSEEEVSKSAQNSCSFVNCVNKSDNSAQDKKHVQKRNNENNTCSISKQNCTAQMNYKNAMISENSDISGKDEKLAFGTMRIQGSQKSTENNQRILKRKLGEESSQFKLSHHEFTLHYKGITVKRNANYTQVMFKFNGRKHNFLSVEDIVELKETLEATMRDPTCKVLLLTGTGNQFCSGLDLQPLIYQRKETVADEMAKSVKELIETLASFSKPLVIAVNGNAMGFAVTLLTYSDVVMASESATFSMPYSQLGYTPEGAGTLTLPQVMGVTMAADMLIRGQPFTAHQAQHHGLVSEVIHQKYLMTYVISRVIKLAKQPIHAMETTKLMMRCHLWDKLRMTLERELQLLPKQWLSLPCQQAIQEAFSDGLFAN